MLLLLFRIRIPELVFLNSYYVGTFSNAIEYSAYSAIASAYSCACVIPKSPSKSKSSKTTHSERFPYVAATS